MAMYVTLGLTDIAKVVNMQSEDEVRDLILHMVHLSSPLTAYLIHYMKHSPTLPHIESNDISASLSSNGTVTFSDPMPEFSCAEVDRMLADVQRQASVLGELDRKVGCGREFLGKVVKTREEVGVGWGAGAGGVDEDVMYGMMGGVGVGVGAWEECVFS